MAQKQLDVLNYRLNYEDFRKVTSSECEVVCELTDRYSIVVKRHKSSTYILLKSGKKCIKLPIHIFNAICNAQISVAYLKSLLETTLHHS